MDSSQWKEHVAGLANDGHIPTIVNYCQHTDANDLNPWWQVDLQSTYNITSVTIANRFDDKPAVGHRLSDTSILVYNSTPSVLTEFTLCKFIPGVFGCTIRTFECDGVAIGRWVRITKPTEYLGLCEVEVTGTEI
ncbi:fucolectin-1-like [Patella vulgata]|uniref:fucolectin-1-like n=1 Tax=Patella vulgata TaxID=6465 RepID=UPI0024A8CF5F|nr:fucolectin-1-like [Patella vulgata]